jgi:hypothetical protein
MLLFKIKKSIIIRIPVITGINDTTEEMQRVKYFFDKDGKLEKKESYSECLLEYIKYVDEEEGVYPLDKDLEYIIKQRGEYVGWWDSENSGYIFKEANGEIIPGINPEIAWLLMCCYIG